MNFSELTPQQKEAVEYCDGPLLLVAGPGTGKSRVLIEKVLYLVTKKSYDPNKILVSTFTIKAAEELRDRLRKRLGDKVETMQISTIHSFCQTMLEDYSEFHRLGSTFSVLDEEDQYIFVKSKYGYQFGLKDFIQPYEVSSLINTFNTLSENNVDSLDLVEHLKKEEASERDIAIAEAYDKYLVALQTENLVDFANLQKEFLYLLESKEDILEKVSNKFDYVLIDEYQDTNPIQDKIFKLIVGERKCICAVGDEDQSIYGFRGASVQNFRSFPEKYTGTKVHNLETNFRSGKEIVDFSDEFMKDHRQYNKKIIPNREKTNNPILIRGKHLTDEAKQSVSLIKDLKESNKIKHYGDISILFRSVRNHSSDYVKYLREFNIPYYVIGDGAFLERTEVRTVLFLMGFFEGFTPAEKQLDEWKWWGNELLLNEVIDLSLDAKAKLQTILLTEDLTKLDASKLKKLDIEKDDMFKILRILEKRKEVIKESEKRKKYSLTSLFYDVLKLTNYLKKIIDLPGDEFEIQKYNLGLLSSIIYKYETTAHTNNFKNFFEHLFYLPDNKSHNSAFIENSKAVRIMTVHQAKGLEFPVVIMGSVLKGRFPSQAAKREDDFFNIPEVFMLYKNKYDSLAEERRLFYVGMTRAQDLLVVATSDGDDKKPSEYIMDEIGINKFSRAENGINGCEMIYEESKDIPRLTYSSINNFLSCPFRYSLNYKYSFQTPPTFFQNYGTVVHNSLQKLHLDLKEGKEITVDRVKEVVMSCWIPVYFDKRKDEKMMFSLVEKVWNYIRKGTKKYQEILEVERPFSFIGDDFIIRGKVDLIAKDIDGSIHITDFKSRNVEGVENTFVDKQLKMYQLALQHEYDISHLYAYTFLDNMRTPFSNSGDELDETRKLIISIGNDIKNERFKRNLKSKFCKTCQYSFLCY